MFLNYQCLILGTGDTDVGAGAYYTFTPEFLAAVKEKGINAFVDGGPVDDDLPNVQPVKKSSKAALIELEVDPVFRVPTPIKTFFDSVILNKKDDITNKNFNNSELKTVKDLIVESAKNKNIYTESLENPFNPLNYIPEGRTTTATRAKMLDDMKGGDLTTPGYVDYNTYNKKTGLGSINSKPGFHSVFSDTGRVLTTLGQFNYSILPNGDVQVTDTYDFNPMLLDASGLNSKRANAFTNTEFSVLSGGYYPLRKLGEKVLPEREGKGRKVNIVLPKDLFSKEEYSSIKNLKTGSPVSIDNMLSAL